MRSTFVMRQPLFVLLATLLLALPACAQEKAPAAGERFPEATAARIDSLAQATRERLVFVKGGTFMMGDQKVRYAVAATGAIDSSRGEPRELYWTNDGDNKPPYEAKLTSYSIQSHEVDYGAYDLFTQMTGREPAFKYLIDEKKRSSNRPVAANWHAARAYCQWIGEQAGIPMDLPTEAQWEYAARSRGRNVVFSTNTDTIAISKNAGEHVPYYQQASPGKANVAYGQVQPVGSFPPNRLGLYDMTSNVAEWVLDWYDPNYYQKMEGQVGVKDNPQGPENGQEKVLRGGSVSNSMTGNTNFSRFGLDPNGLGGGKVYSKSGFRCVANQNEPIK